MTLVLERYCRVQSVATYQQALRRTRRVQFDLIFVTVKRRGQQAASDLLETLRAREAYAEVPIVIIDGTSSGGTDTQSRPIGGDATLRMPFERAELVDVLRRHLGGE